MSAPKFTKQIKTIFELAVDLAVASKADAILVMVEHAMDWEKIRNAAGDFKVILAGDKSKPDDLFGAETQNLLKVTLDTSQLPVLESLTQALLEAVAEDLLVPGADVISVYSCFDPGSLDAIGYIRLEDHLGRLTSRDLKNLSTSVPLETLKAVVDLAHEIGKEGREGKPVGTMFVVGDTPKVLKMCQEMGFDCVKGYKSHEKNIRDARCREAIKEVAQLDGAFIVDKKGVVVKSCQRVDPPQVDLTMSPGLGTRHWAAASVSKTTKCVAVAVSQSTGTVRIFQNGEVVLRIEPFRRATKWKDLDREAELKG
jgi:diadenylate cyclase